MSDYDPPDSENVNFELSYYVPQDKDTVDFNFQRSDGYECIRTDIVLDPTLTEQPGLRVYEDTRVDMVFDTTLNEPIITELLFGKSGFEGERQIIEVVEGEID